LVSVAPGIKRIGDFRVFLDADFDEAADFMALRKAESVGRPIGDSDWISALEAKTGRVLKAQKRGPVARDVDKSA
jgi:putative transposase